MNREFIRPNVFISACIEFESCRFDGTMISDEFIKRLSELVNVTRVCPEMMIGLGAPRESVRLVERKGETLKLLESKTGKDYTDEMMTFSAKYVERLKDKDIDGFILKAKSPTCGVRTVKIYFDTGKSHAKSTKNAGMFGKMILDTFPNVPVETERRISNFAIRDRFFIELFTLAKYRDIKSRLKMKELVQFHTNNKYMFMGYNQTTLKTMGNIVANHNHHTALEVFDEYEIQLRKLLSKEQSTKKRINVLTHIYGYFKDEISKEEKDYYFEVQNEYLDNRVPYSSVLTVLKGWTIRFGQSYLVDQTIFAPYPKELIMVTDSGKTV